jgi:hypothetical protein
LHVDPGLSPDRTPLSADSRPVARARPHPARHEPAHHRSPRSGVRRAGAQGAGGHQEDLPDAPPGGDLSGLRHRRVGGGADQRPEPRRPGGDVRDRALRVAVAQDGLAAGGSDRISRLARQRTCRAGQLAARRAGGFDRAAPDSRHPAPDQGRVRGAQRNLDRRDQRYRRRASRHRRCEAPRAADGRHHLRPGLGRLPPR